MFFAKGEIRKKSLGRRQVMPMKRYKPEPIVNLPRQIEVEIAKGKTLRANQPILGGVSLGRDLEVAGSIQ
jgi:hypothetical protein